MASQRYWLVGAFNRHKQTKTHSPVDGVDARGRKGKSMLC